MMRRSLLSRFTSLLAVCSMAWLSCPSPVFGQTDQPAGTGQQEAAVLEAEIQRATARAADKGYLLEYRFQKGESLRMKVVQLVSMQTRVDGNDQNVQSRSVSTRQWDVRDIDAEGNITFTHMIKQVSMWQKVTGKDEIRYDSTKDKQPPEPYRLIAEKLGKPLSTITMARDGRLVKRKDQARQFDPGIDSLVIPLPDKLIHLGHRWYTPEKLRIRTQAGIYKTVQLRRQYKLESVEAGVAMISITTQVLTPVDDPTIKSQIVQRLQNGSIRFDITRGRILSKQLHLDQRVIGFNGPASLVHYQARTREEILKDATLQ
ncbi:MAG: hypothetical protein VB855_02920 [Pirellulaceae bacterium]